MSDQSPRLLVVEDNRDTAALLRDLLEAEGYQVDSVGTGEAAFEKLDESPDVDLMVLDLMLPGMSGYDVIERLRAESIRITGPHPADTLFHARARATYDVALAPTHDQALIPIKTLAFDEGVNVTLGLPFLRTSPDHGTAFDIAGKGLAKPDSLIAALKLAGRLTRPHEEVAA